MAQRSFDAFKLWKDAQLKFDYYMVGLIAAVFTYTASKFIPEEIAFSQNSFELLAVVFLAISFYLGLKRLEIDLVIQTISLKKTENTEMLHVARENVLSGGSHNLDDGTYITVDDAKKRAIECQEIKAKLDRAFKVQAKKSEKLFKFRNRSLAIALFLIVFSKVLGVYSI